LKLKILFLTLAFYILFLVQPVEEPVEDSTIEAGMLNSEITETEDLPSLEEIYLEGGYTEVSKALNEAEDYFKKEIPLPTRLPEVVYTHHFGRFGTLEKQLEITYLNEDSGHTHYKIVVTSPEPEQKSIKGQPVKLKDGSEAIYRISEHFDVMTFEKDGFEYMLMVDKIHPDKISKEVLIAIANSIK
jgi:hypothetical protein